MNENEEVALKIIADVELNDDLTPKIKIKEESPSSLDSSPPASPIREELIRFDSNSPGLRSLDDYYASNIMSDVSLISTNFKDFCKLDDNQNDEAYESGRSSENSSSIMHETDVPLEKISEEYVVQQGNQTNINRSFILDQPDKKRQKLQ